MLGGVLVLGGLLGLVASLRLNESSRRHESRLRESSAVLTATLAALLPPGVEHRGGLLPLPFVNRHPLSKTHIDQASAGEGSRMRVHIKIEKLKRTWSLCLKSIEEG